jgi:FAD/FMN-containing dehydrogenase
VDGTEYGAVPASLAEAAVRPGEPAYPQLASTFRRGAPGIVLLPRTVEQVVDAVGFAGRQPHVPLGIRSGGHGLSGRSTNDGGIVVTSEPERHRGGRPCSTARPHRPRCAVEGGRRRIAAARLGAVIG